LQTAKGRLEPMLNCQKEDLCCLTCSVVRIKHKVSLG
jgi:hypothetical protein